MAQDPAFLFYPGDYLRDTQCLSANVQVAYDRIMCEHMRNICEDMTNIAVSKDKVNFFTKRLSEDEKFELFSVLKKTGAGYQILWVAESIYKRNAYSNSRRKNKQGKPKNISSSYDVHMENEIENVNEVEIDNEIGNFLVPEMMKIFKLRNPKYKENKQRDFQPLLSIANFLLEQGGANGVAEDNKAKILEAWDPLCVIISKDKWFQTKPLSVISKMIQEVTQIALHGKSNGTDYGSKDRAEQYDKLFTERYGKR